MRTILTHFHNEAYLLPWWLEHHLKIFEHGVLIDHGSTDESADICRTLAPHWDLVRSNLADFDAYLTDFEVMKHEEQLAGFKIAMTTTEFLLTGIDLHTLERNLVLSGAMAVKIPAAILVDVAPEEAPSHRRSLVAQKHHGYLEAAHPGLGPPGVTNYARIYHRGVVGQYHPGRHGSYLPGADVIEENVFVFKYIYAPWTQAMKARKLQIGARVSASDKVRSWGWQHHLNAEELDAKRLERLPLSQDLTQHPVIARALAR